MTLLVFHSKIARSLDHKSFTIIGFGITEEFQTSDPWEDFIVSYTEHRDYLRLSDLLSHLQVDLSRQERSHQMRCSAILKKMGWEGEFRMIREKRVRVWAKLEPDELADRARNRPTQKTEVDREVDHLAP
ncbi:MULTISPECIES: hypothetical protein [unclassified Microcoleus]|uniref:hypothetical protein n=1 Tax=unclassified Microcoleus TaxID=2642155 RepID=UPI002FD5EE0E